MRDMRACMAWLAMRPYDVVLEEADVLVLAIEAAGSARVGEDEEVP